MDYKVGNVRAPFELEEDLTTVAPCTCSACVEVTEAIALARSSGRLLRLTTMHACLADTALPWMAAADDSNGRIVATGKGTTEHEAIYELLVQLGIAESRRCST